MAFYIWDNRKSRSQLYIIETRLPAIAVENFLRDVFDMGKIIAVSNNIEFVEDDLHVYLGDLVEPNVLHRRLSPEFIKNNLSCIRACQGRWTAKKLHPDQDRYLILISQVVPKDETKQVDLFE